MGLIILLMIPLGIFIVIISRIALPKIHCPKCDYKVVVDNNALKCPNCKTRFIVDKKTVTVKEILH